MPFLLKTEPEKYSFDDLLREGETIWDGISNPQALKSLREMSPRDKLVIYHSNTGKAVVGPSATRSTTGSSTADRWTVTVVVPSGGRMYPHQRGAVTAEPEPTVERSAPDRA